MTARVSNTLSQNQTLDLFPNIHDSSENNRSASGLLHWDFKARDTCVLIAALSLMNIQGIVNYCANF